jgi:hypothetical protein
MPWSKCHTACVECGTTDLPHKGLGRCIRCYQRLRYRESPQKIRERGWTQTAERCRVCGSNERRHAGRGLCSLCYIREYRKIPEALARLQQSEAKYAASEKGHRFRRRQARVHRERRRGIEVGVPAGYEELVFSIFGKKCVSCGATQKLTLDHHCPLERGNPLLHNAVPLCGAYNSSKSHKAPEAFYATVKLREIEVLLKKTREAFEAAQGRPETP